MSTSNTPREDNAGSGLGEQREMMAIHKSCAMNRPLSNPPRPVPLTIHFFAALDTDPCGSRHSAQFNIMWTARHANDQYAQTRPFAGGVRPIV